MRIGELSDRLGVNPKTVRYYESIGLIPEPARTASGYRDYDEADAERLRFVKTAQRLGLPLDEIREIMAFRERSERPCGYVLGVLRDQVATLDGRITEMRHLRDELRQLLSDADRRAGEEASFCSLIEHATPSGTLME